MGKEIHKMVLGFFCKKGFLLGTEIRITCTVSLSQTEHYRRRSDLKCFGSGSVWWKHIFGLILDLTDPIELGQIMTLAAPLGPFVLALQFLCAPQIFT